MKPSKKPNNLKNLHNLLLESTLDEKRLGYSYYEQQYSNLESFAKASRKPVDRVIAAFAALSPNNAESTNYLALASVLAICMYIVPESAPVIAFPNAKQKALTILRDNRTPIESVLQGLKTYSFYRNTLNPDDKKFVTIDGHMYNAWRNEVTPLQEAGITRKQYYTIQRDVRKLSNSAKLTPARLQSILWITWKRLHRILSSAQLPLESGYSQDRAYQIIVQSPKFPTSYQSEAGLSIVKDTLLTQAAQLSLAFDAEPVHTGLSTNYLPGNN